MSFSASSAYDDASQRHSLIALADLVGVHARDPLARESRCNASPRFEAAIISADVKQFTVPSRIGAFNCTAGNSTPE
jgi:hypothetical protein